MTDNEDRPRSILDPAVLRRLFRHLEATDVDELEVTWGRSRLYLRREPGTRAATGVHTSAVADAVRGTPISAPLTGVYYSRSSPEQPPFVAEGDAVVPGQVVALIETMKLFNEVTADRAGEVLSIVVTDGDLVDIGQPLMYVGSQDEGDMT